MFTKGTKIEIRTAAHPYSHAGHVDPTCIIPEEVTVATVKSVRQVKNGTRVSFYNENGTQPYTRNFSVVIDRMEHTTFTVVA